MDVRFDHVVLWVRDPLRSVEFYEAMLGLRGVRVAEFREGKAPFPSVRLTEDSIVDLVPMPMAALLNTMPGAEGSAGNKVNHLCLAMSKADYDDLRARLTAAGIATPVTMRDTFGARGHAPEAFYFPDPDGNIIEARHYA